MHWLVTVVLPIGISVFGLYIASSTRSASLEHRLTELEVMNKAQERMLDSHGIRLDKHEEEQRVMLSLVEQIRALTGDIGELKSDLKEVRNRLEVKQ